MSYHQSSTNVDARIRAAIRDAEGKGKLAAVAAAIGLSVEELHRIMDSSGELRAMDRGMLALHLLGETPP